MRLFRYLQAKLSHSNLLIRNLPRVHFIRLPKSQTISLDRPRKLVGFRFKIGERLLRSKEGTPIQLWDKEIDKKKQ